MSRLVLPDTEMFTHTSQWACGLVPSSFQQTYIRRVVISILNDWCRSESPVNITQERAQVLRQGTDLGLQMTERGENAPRQRLRKEIGSGCPSKLLRVHMRGMVKPFDVNSS